MGGNSAMPGVSNQLVNNGSNAHATVAGSPMASNSLSNDASGPSEQSGHQPLVAGYPESMDSGDQPPTLQRQLPLDGATPFMVQSGEEKPLDDGKKKKKKYPKKKKVDGATSGVD